MPGSAAPRGLISLLVSIVRGRHTAYRLPVRRPSVDALESIVNVVAAVFALGGLVFAGRPADRNHPYGHGKIEFFSAAFEGGLIAFAAVLIIYEVVQSLIRGVEVRQIEAGLAIVLAAGLANLLLGLFLVRTGRRHSSLTLVADGQHVLSDFWTSVGIVLGLVLVRLTGLAWLDPVVAALVALNLMWTGGRLVRHAAGGLLDEEDSTAQSTARGSPRLGADHPRITCAPSAPGGFITWRPPGGAGFWSSRTHIWPRPRREVIERSGEGELVFHTDPATGLLRHVRSDDCPVRRPSWAGLTLDDGPSPKSPDPIHPLTPI
jgi:hypothetical protein